MLIAIDLDGVLHDNTDPPKLGKPILDAQPSMKRLQRNGHQLVIFSTRATPDFKPRIATWLMENKIPFHDITNVKPNADIFLDDKAIKFTTWGEVIHELK